MWAKVRFRVIENTNGYVACVDETKKVRRIHIDTLIDEIGLRRRKENVR